MDLKRLTISGFPGVILVCLVVVLLTSGMAGAADLLPGAEYLGEITMDKSLLKGPDGIAAGPDNSLYIVDSLRNQILKADGRGHYIGKIPFAQVSAVGVGPDNTLYIGSHRNYSVAIVRNGKTDGYLGQGAGEFSSVRGITADAGTGKIYVVDNLAGVVKVYDPAGKKLMVLEGLNLPVGAAVSNNEIFVLDAPVGDDAAHSMSTGARISVFDRSGRRLGSFAESSAGDVRPSGIAIDNSGNIYVSDAQENTVYVCNAAGILLGVIEGGGDGIRGAVGLTISPDGVLYVASGLTHSIQMFSLDSGSRNNITGVRARSDSLGN